MRGKILVFFIIFILVFSIKPQNSFSLAPCHTNIPIYLPITLNAIFKGNPITFEQVLLQKEHLIQEISTYLKQEAKTYPYVQKFLSLAPEEVKTKFKTYCHAITLFNYLQGDSLFSKEKLFEELTAIYKDAELDEKYSTDTEPIKASLQTSISRLAVHNKESLYMFFGLLAHELGHRELLRREDETLKIDQSTWNLSRKAVDEAFADMRAFVLLENLNADKIIDFLNALYYLNEYGIKNNFNGNIVCIVTGDETEEINGLKEKGIIKNKNWISSSFGHSKKEFKETEQNLYDAYFKFLLEKDIQGLHFGPIARYSLYRLIKFLQEDYFDLRWFLEYLNDLKISNILELLKEKKILETDPYHLTFIKFTNYKEFIACQSESDLLSSLKAKLGPNISLENQEELENITPLLYKALNLLIAKKSEKPITYLEIANAMTKEINSLFTNKKNVFFIPLIMATLKYFNIDMNKHMSSKVWTRYISDDPHRIFSMSLVSKWKNLLKPSETFAMFQEQSIKLNALPPLTIINEQAFNQATKEEKLLLVLQFLKTHITDEKFSSIMDKQLYFFTQKFMPNLANTNGQDKITLHEKTFENWRILFVEVLHELIHLSNEREISTNIEKIISEEITVYKELSDLLKKILTDKDKEELIKALTLLKDANGDLLFEEDGKKLSYPLILKELLADTPKHDFDTLFQEYIKINVYA